MFRRKGYICDLKSWKLVLSFLNSRTTVLVHWKRTYKNRCTHFLARNFDSTLSEVFCLYIFNLFLGEISFCLLNSPYAYHDAIIAYTEIASTCLTHDHSCTHFSSSPYGWEHYGANRWQHLSFLSLSAAAALPSLAGMRAPRRPFISAPHKKQESWHGKSRNNLVSRHFTLIK